MVTDSEVCKACIRKHCKVVVSALKRTDDIDFENIVPMPKVVKLSYLPIGMSTEYHQEHGTRNWYGWCTQNWGTKWNAYDINLVDGGMTFDTAWGFPKPVMVALSELFPELTITCTYIDEGWNFAGWSIFSCGTMIDSGAVECSKEDAEFCELCLELKGYDPQDEED